MVGERLGRAEDTEEPVAQGLGRDERVEELPALGVTGLRLDEPDEPEEGQIGVGGGAEGVEEQRVGAHGGEVRHVEEPLGGGGIRETVPQQPRERTAPAPLRHRHRTASCSFTHWSRA